MGGFDGGGAFILLTRYQQAKKTTLPRLIHLFHAKKATINFELRRIKLIFVANSASNEHFYTSKRQLA